MADISNNIKKLRVLHGLSQEKLAEKIGVTRQTISSWERGTSFPDIATVERLSLIFNISIDELLYPLSSTKRNWSSTKLPTLKFVVLSVLIYFVLLVWGGGFIAIPIFKNLVGGGINEEFIFVIYWGLILLVGYIALCTGLISEQLSGRGSECAPDKTDTK
ncbi:MAG: helix-turn-helix transcriptional regulator [Candidatus Heteroscillospira sp.]|jgi:transcriptional regulator with XRE-family HTH domain